MAIFVTEDGFLIFKKRVQDYIEGHQSNYFELFRKQFETLRDNCDLIKLSIAEINLKEAINFNIFQILGLGHLEVRTHTPLLAELLDRNGSHGQKQLFLEKFLEYLNFCPDEAYDSSWNVIKERENIDLQLINYRLRKAVFIENKIYSGSHSGQLSRYYSMWKKCFPNGGEFLYLTITGVPPDDAGFNEEYPRDVVEKDLKRISYKKHIKEWLEATLPHIQATKVKETIVQYLFIIKTL